MPWFDKRARTEDAKRSSNQHVYSSGDLVWDV